MKANNNPLEANTEPIISKIQVNETIPAKTTLIFKQDNTNITITNYRSEPIHIKDI